MRSFALTICLLAFVTIAAMPGRDAAAGDWRFRRSYFTHRMSPEWVGRGDLPVSRSAYRHAYPSQLPGFSVQGGFRINRVQINGGHGIDTTIIYEGWFQWRP